MSILLRQTRIGKGGIPFTVYKIRTMKKGCEKVPVFFDKFKSSDPRVMKFGRFMRRTGLDEIPQVYNILRGEMSLVGPRPMSPCFLEKVSPEQKALRQMIKPGLVGVIYIKPVDSFETALKNEMIYLNELQGGNRFLVDVKYFFRIAFNLLSGRVRKP